LLADRIGPRILITIGICGVALAGLLVGFSQTYIMMLVFLVLMGLAGGGYHPSAAPLISASVEPKNRGRALGFHMIGGSGSYFLAPLIAAAIAAASGWRGSFISLAIPTAVFGIIFYILLGRRAIVSKEQLMADDHPEEIPSAPGNRRRLVAFMVLSVFTQAVFSATIAFIPLFLVDHFGIAKEAAVAFIAIIYSAGLWAGPLGGYLSDRLGRVPVVLVVCLAAGPVIYLLNLVPGGFGVGALLLVMGMVMYTRMPVSEAYVVTHTPKRHLSAVLGIYFFASMEAGGVLSPVMGSRIDHFGFYLSFMVAGAALIAVTLVCSIWLWGSRD